MFPSFLPPTQIFVILNTSGEIQLDNDQSNEIAEKNVQIQAWTAICFMWAINISQSLINWIFTANQWTSRKQQLFFYPPSTVAEHIEKVYQLFFRFQVEAKNPRVMKFLWKGAISWRLGEIFFEEKWRAKVLSKKLLLPSWSRSWKGRNTFPAARIWGILRKSVILTSRYT